MSSENPPIGEVDSTHVGPPDLILQEIVAPSEVPEEIRKRVERSFQPIEDEGVVMAEPLSGGRPGRAPEGWCGTAWSDATFAGRALALVEGMGQLDYDDYGDPLVWIFALRAESPVLGEAIVSVGGFASNQTFLSDGPAKRAGKRVSFFSAIRTEPRGMPNVHFGRH